MSLYRSKFPPAPREVLDLVDKRFCEPDRHGYGRYRRNDDGEEIIKETLYSMILEAGTHLVRLQMFRGLKGLAGELWPREVRTMQRISSMRSLGVPQIVDGGVIEEDDFAFILTRSSTRTLASEYVLDQIRARPIEALNHFGVLADALSLMHEHGLVHRNLWTGIVEYHDRQTTPEVKLSRFEMSALLTNLIMLRSVQPDVIDHASVRNALLTQSHEALACFSPERLQALAAGNVNSGSVETERSDIYSLGVIAWQMFVGPLPDEALALVGSEGAIDLKAARALRRVLHTRLMQADLPVDIKGLLYTMMHEDWKERPSSMAVSSDLTSNHRRNSRYWLPKQMGKAHQIVIIPPDMIYPISRWGWLDYEPGEELWAEELCTLIKQDVSKREMAYSPEGYWGRDTEVARASKYVFIGEKAVWFCTIFRDEAGKGRERPEILLVRFVDKRESPYGVKASRLSPTGTCPEVEVTSVAHGISPMAVDSIVAGKPPWLPLFEPLRGRVEAHGNRELFRDALEFLIDYQDALLMGRYYAYRKVPGSESAGFVTVTFDEPRDKKMRDLLGKERRLHSYINIYDGPYRPSFGRFLTSESTYDGAWEVVFSRDNNGTPEARPTAEGTVRRSNHSREVTIQLNSERGYVPEQGWVRPATDSANAVNLERQRAAKNEFLRFANMLDRLLTPVGIPDRISLWDKVGEDLRYPKDAEQDRTPHEQRDDNQRFLIDMLRLTPLYMLMGPPGTGKTTTVATAIEAFLQKEPSARVLLSAQSHFALDNLGEKVLEKVDETAVIRATTRDSESKVAPRMRKCLPPEQARRMINSIKTEVPRALSRYKDTLNADARGAVEEWLARLDASQAELAERLVRGASVVLATTSAATPDTLGYGARVGIFDWVVVEEVAKAWITEIAAPLSRGYRWALVGDPEQLPAHRREDVDRLLNELSLEKFKDDPVLSSYGANRERLARVFDFFKIAFSQQGADKVRRTAMKPATGRLVRQFRMRKPIGDLISDAFYKSGGQPGLITPPEAERPAKLVRPAVLADDCALVWMDTSRLQDCREEPYWRNEGETRLIREMLFELDPWPTPNAPNQGPESLAILTPYNQQRNDLIREITQRVLGPRSESDPRVPAPGPDASIVHNVHTVQGREFDIVIVSLVRTGDAASATSTGLGFLEWRYLINVLFSRARRQLVVFGNFDFFRNVDIEHWKIICQQFKAHGKVVPLDPDDPGGAN